MTLLSKNARVAGFLYILASVVGVVRLMYIPSTLFVSGNATATAANVAAHESLFRWGIVSSLLGAALWLFVPLALYRLLKGVDRSGDTLQVAECQSLADLRLECPRIHVRSLYPSRQNDSCRLNRCLVASLLN
jgi:uncharacterized membrane protein